jgi:phage baseplate assembly protein W
VNSILGKDIRILSQFSAHATSSLDLVRTDRLARTSSGIDELTDVAVLEHRENLAQALTLRLLTPRGALKDLGHANYGSRLHELVGRQKNETNRNLCRLFVLEAVAQEPRVADKAVSFAFDRDRETIASFYFDLVVKPKDGGDDLTLGLEVGL